MPLVLQVDGTSWRARLKEFADATPGLVPVIKGNGYGFGRTRLAGVAAALGADLVAVSDPEEVASVRQAFTGDILVMTPWLADREVTTAGSANAGVLRTIGHLTALEPALGSDATVVLEGVTSMRRHGITPEDFDRAAPLLKSNPPSALALHLPIDRPQGSDPMAEVEAWVQRHSTAGVALSTVFVSHLHTDELRRLGERHPTIRFRPRIGTDFWLGRRSDFAARATVLDVRPLRAGDRFGYRQQRVARSSTLLVLSGGTAHGIGLEAPVTPRGVVRRGKRLAAGILESFGRTLSPFTVSGQRRWYAEPPHMQVSMVLLPAGATAPAVGEEVDLDVRMTATSFDAVRGLDS